MTSSLLLIFSFSITAYAGAVASIRFTPGPAHASLWFEPNRAECPGGVQFLGRAAGFTVLLEPGGAAAYALPAADARAAQLVRMVAVRARPGVMPVAEDLLPSAVHYYGQDAAPAEGVPNYGRVRYAQLYPGIDLIWHSRGGTLEYEFSVASGADPARIRLRIEGAHRAYLDAAGDLILETPGGRLRQRRPFAWQDRDGKREPVAVGYRLRGGAVSFRLGQYDRERPLIIDPELSFSSYLGGSGFDAAYGIAVDSEGNIYVTGETASANFPAPAGSPQLVRYNRDVFITKLSPDGRSVLYTTILSSRGNDAGRAIAVDSSGTAYVTGSVGDGGFPVTAGVLKASYGGSGDAFVAHLDPSGRVIYSTYLGGGGADIATGIAIDSAGNAYVTGYTSSLAFPTTAGAPQPAHRGGFYDAFVAKLNSAGTALVYSTLLGGPANDLARAIAANQSGEACIAGYTESRDLPVRNAIQPMAGAGGDAVIGCLNAAGTGWNWVTYFGGRGRDEANALALDGSGNVYVTGSTFSDDFRTTAGAFQASKRAQYDAFAIKLDPAGATLRYSTLLGGNGPDTGAAIAVGVASQAWIAGSTASTDLPVRDGWQMTPLGSYDAFVCLVSSDATAINTCSYLGGNADDRAWGLALTTSAQPLVVGYTSSPDFPSAASASHLVAPGSYETFVAHIGLNTGPAPVSVVPNSGADAEQTFVFSAADVDGYQDIDLVQVLFARQLSGVGACFLNYTATGLFLMNDSGTAWLPPVRLGTTGVLENSQCAIDPGRSSSTSSGSTLTLALAVAFKPTFSGALQVYTYSHDRAGIAAPWQVAGDWSVPSPALSSTVSPSFGTGMQRTFVFTTIDANGYQEIDLVQLLFGRRLSGVDACFMNYTAAGLFLMNDSGTAWQPPVRLGSTGVLENSQCAIDVGRSSSTGSGSTLTLAFAITFKARISGPLQVYTYSHDRVGLTAPWQVVGSWSVPSPTLSPPTVSPNSGTGTQQTFVFAATDANGYQEIDLVQLLFARQLSGVGACFLNYTATGLFLMNDSGIAWLPPVRLSTTGVLENSQCAIDVGRSSSTATGSTLTLALAVTFKAPFSGPLHVYTYSHDRVGLTAPWQIAGSWTP